MALAVIALASGVPPEAVGDADDGCRLPVAGTRNRGKRRNASPISTPRPSFETLTVISAVGTSWSVRLFAEKQSQAKSPSSKGGWVSRHPGRASQSAALFFFHHSFALTSIIGTNW